MLDFKFEKIINSHQAMAKAIDLAQQAMLSDEVPVGAVVVFEDSIIGYGANQTIRLSDPSAHAEMLAIRMAAKNINNYRLKDCQLYVTLEPCLMCLGAIVHSRISQVHFAVHDAKTGSCGGFIDLINPTVKINHHCKFSAGLMAEESKKLLQSFFAQKRNKLK